MHASFSFIINRVVGSTTKMAAALGMCLVFKTIYSFLVNTHLKYPKWKEKAFKELLRTSYSEKRRTLSDEILLQGTSYVLINAGRYFFFGSQNRRSGVLTNFQAAEGLNGKRNYIFR